MKKIVTLIILLTVFSGCQSFDYDPKADPVEIHLPEGPSFSILYEEMRYDCEETEY